MASKGIRRLYQRRRMGHDTITLSEARSRLDARRFSRPNTHFAAVTVLKIYKNIICSQLLNVHRTRLMNQHSPQPGNLVPLSVRRRRPRS